ncbi:MAG: class I SAM-dependent methyltransferase [Promethearchaeota archaeon]
MRKKQTNFNIFQSQLKLPYLNTNYTLLPEIFELLELNFDLKRSSRQKFIDLGSGDGNICIFITLNYDIRSYGIEIDQNLIIEAECKINLFRKENDYAKSQLKKVKFIHGDFYDLKLKKYDFIYIYSLPSMQKFLKHVFNTVKKKAIIISHKHPLKDFTSILKEEYTLPHKYTEQELYTYYYKKFEYS